MNDKPSLGIPSRRAFITAVTTGAVVGGSAGVSAPAYADQGDAGRAYADPLNGGAGSARYKANAAALGISPDADDLGSFTNSLLPDSENVKGVFESLAAKVAHNSTKVVNLSDYEGARPDGTGNSSSAAQEAIDDLAARGGGTLIIDGDYVVGDLTIPTRYVNISGRGEGDKLIVKNGTTGITVRDHWCSITNLTITSQGTFDDQLGTNGVLYIRGDADDTVSVGFFNNTNLTFQGFSGYAMRVAHVINSRLERVYIKECTIGVDVVRVGKGPSDFSTTFTVEDLYVTDCHIGFRAERLYRSRINMIGERCDHALDAYVGNFTMWRCYFEKNRVLGAKIVNCTIQNLYTYSNNRVTDAVEISFEPGAVRASDRGYQRSRGSDYVAKRLGVLSKYGLDEKFLTGVGDTTNLGLKYDEAIVPRVYGEDLLDPLAWRSETTSEFQGWDVNYSGYKVASELSGVRGMRQSVSLDAERTYVIDFSSDNVTGRRLTELKVGDQYVAAGVPFRPSTTGSLTVKAFGVQIAPSENYIRSIRLMEVLEDRSLIAKTVDQLLRTPRQRADLYSPAAPTAGTFAIGEIVWNASPQPGGFVGWVCTGAGTPGTWRGFGAIEQ